MLNDKSVASSEAAISLLLRYSVPVFFRAANGVAPPTIAWQVTRGNNSYAIRAANHGDARLRVSQISLATPGGDPVALNGGLVGYVLGGSPAAAA